MEVSGCFGFWGLLTLYDWLTCNTRVTACGEELCVWLLWGTAFCSAYRRGRGWSSVSWVWWVYSHVSCLWTCTNPEWRAGCHQRLVNGAVLHSSSCTSHTRSTRNSGPFSLLPVIYYLLHCLWAAQYTALTTFCYFYIFICVSCFLCSLLFYLLALKCANTRSVIKIPK